MSNPPVNNNHQQLEEEINFSETVSSFKSEDISSNSPISDQDEEQRDQNQYKDFDRKVPLPRDAKPERMSSAIYKKVNNLDKNKKKPKITETGYRKYSPHAVFLYKPGVMLPDLSDHLNGMIEIRIAKEYLINSNKELLKRSIWGSETFTSNSDAVCILKHAGMLDFNNLNNLKNNDGCSLFCKITKARKTYNPSTKNGLKTRGIKGYQGFSLKPDHITTLANLGKQDELNFIAARMATCGSMKRVKTPPASGRKHGLFHQNHLVFNLSDELAFKYSISNICDKSNDPTTWTSYQLKKKSFYFETKDERFELANMLSEKTEEEEVFSTEDHYKLSKILKPYFTDNKFMETAEVPLKSEFVELIFENLEWNDIKWGETMIQMKEKCFENVRNYKFYQNKEGNNKVGTK